MDLVLYDTHGCKDGHSWLRVSFDELHDMQIASQISSFSYMSRLHGVTYAYLTEEDAVAFYQAARGPYVIRRIVAADPCFVCILPRYTPPRRSARLAGVASHRIGCRI